MTAMGRLWPEWVESGRQLPIAIAHAGQIVRNDNTKTVTVTKLNAVNSSQAIMRLRVES
jgi:hypothetical protein